MMTILWFKRDLRISDHPALAFASVGEGAMLPLYIAEPEYWALPDTSARQWRFTAECLASLGRDLAALGAPLQVRTGEAVPILRDLAAAHGVTRIVSHQETGNLWTFRRDLAVRDWARANGIEWVELPQSGVVRRLSDRDGWARAREKEMRAPLVVAPAALRGVDGLMPCAVPDARDLGLAFDPCHGRQKGGRDLALSTLNGFLTERGLAYRGAMSSPVRAERACSRLSPYLALGAVSMREVAQAAAVRKSEAATARDGWSGSITAFSSRLAWRDHFMQKLEDEPTIETRCLHSAYETLRPRAPDAARLAAWEKGETGLPFVDACMRFLVHGGWLNFRMRAMLMSVASYHLWLDWRSTGPHLARMFTDYEPGIHWIQCQMQSGTTGMNTIRIYNPVKQGHDQDPSGSFTRKWLPELSAVPDRFLQEPWLWDRAGSLLGRKYPAPIIDVRAAAGAARDAVWGLRKGDAFGRETARLIRKHASRKESAAGLAPARNPRRTVKRAVAQMCFEFRDDTPVGKSHGADETLHHRSKP